MPLICKNSSTHFTKWVICQDFELKICFFVCNRGYNIQYHNGLRSRELGQAPMLLGFLFSQAGIIISHASVFVLRESIFLKYYFFSLFTFTVQGGAMTSMLCNLHFIQWHLTRRALVPFAAVSGKTLIPCDVKEYVQRM